MIDLFRQKNEVEIFYNYEYFQSYLKGIIDLERSHRKISLGILNFMNFQHSIWHTKMY